MTKSRSDNPLGQIRTLFEVGIFGGLSDGELLDRFSAGGDEVSELAIAVLIERHGPMVHRVCRSMLNNPHDAEDAFQAAFLVLARQAASIRNRDSVASWLHGVARRVAACSLDAEARRRKHERAASRLEAIDAPHECDETSRIVHDELGRLPEKYRAPIVLCHLEGLTHEQAASRLRCPVGTVRSRLSRGRNRLRDRLVRRGAAPAAVASVSFFSDEIASAGVSLSLVRETVQLTSVGPIPPSISSLVTGALKAMAVSNMKIAGALIAVVMTSSGLGLFAAGAIRAQDKPESPIPDSKIDAAVKSDEGLSRELKITPGDRIDLGQLHVGALAEAEFHVRYYGPAAPGMELRVVPPPFATVTRTRTLRRTSIRPTGESMFYEVTISVDTKTAGIRSGTVRVEIGEKSELLRIYADVRPEEPYAVKVLAIMGGFGPDSGNSSIYETWHKIVNADKIDVSYCGIMAYLGLDIESDPTGKTKLPDALARYDVIFIDGGGASWLRRRDAFFLKLFIDSGKRVIVAAGPGIMNSVDGANYILESVGLKMDPGDVRSPGSEYFQAKETQLVTDSLTDRVSNLNFFHPTRIKVTDPKIAKILDKEGKEGFLAVSRPGKGEVVAVGTTQVVSWIGKDTEDSDNLRCLRNLLTKPVK